MDKKVKVVKPSLTTHTRLIGGISYILSKSILDEIKNDLDLSKELVLEIENILSSKLKIDYKILNKVRNTLL